MSVKRRYCNLGFGLRACSSLAEPSMSATASDEQLQHLMLLERIGESLGIKKLADWYSVSPNQIIQHGGKKLLTNHNENRRAPSILPLLKQVYPTYPWRTELFASTPSSNSTQKGKGKNMFPSSTKKSSWRDTMTQKQFLDSIGNQLGVTKPSDWYGISRQRVIEMGGGSLFLYHSSLLGLLKAIYPDYEWDHHKFVEQGNKAPTGYWKDRDNLMKELGRVEAQIGVTKPEDWYSVTLADIREIGFPNIKKQQLLELLTERYPSYPWEPLRLLKGKLSQQRRFERVVASLFPDVERKINTRKESGLINPATGDYLELDIYIPSLKLAFEYQEKHHFVSQGYTYLPLEELRKKDSVKKDLAQKKGITLIVVPFWWDGTAESLIATIRNARPDLLNSVDDVSDGVEAIPDTMPDDVLQASQPHIDDIGQPTTASFFTLSKIDPAGWWMFEKYDGVRGFWNPLKRAFYSRHGNKFSFPQEIIDAMPADLFLDGELWFGRDNFQEAMKIANRMEFSRIDWTKFKFMVFDVPTHKVTYQERYNYLLNAVGGKAEGKCKYIEVAEKHQCTDIEHLEKFFQDIIDEGGEGVILRDPKAPFLPGRSPGYLKHKKFRDAEAKVVLSVGQARWECELPDGTRFVAGAATTEFLKRSTPRPGDIVSFKHHGFLLNSNKPKLPTIYRMRDDMMWEDVVNNWKENKKASATAAPIRPKTKKMKPKGYWLNQENQRRFFTEYAEAMGFDPLDPKKWQKVTMNNVFMRKGAGPLFRFESLKEALASAFPELAFSEIFEDTKKDWTEANNSREFFERFAKEKGFDPSDPENWYTTTLKQMLGRPGGRAIRSHYKGLRNALMAAYPEVKFDKWTREDHQSQE